MGQYRKEAGLYWQGSGQWASSSPLQPGSLSCTILLFHATNLFNSAQQVTAKATVSASQKAQLQKIPYTCA